MPMEHFIHEIELSLNSNMDLSIVVQDQKDQIHLVQRCEQIKQSKKHSFHSYLYPKLEGKK